MGAVPTALEAINLVILPDSSLDATAAGFDRLGLQAEPSSRHAE